MQSIPRILASKILSASSAFGAVVLTGPRRVGKTWLLRHAFPGAQWVLLEDPIVISAVRTDPRGFLDQLRLPVILDEIQNVPELFSHIRARIDTTPNSAGNWLITGSQEFSMMQGVSDSMAGRAAIFGLWPIGIQESPTISLLSGGFPEVLAEPEQQHRWFASYVQTWLERDVRAVLNVADLPTFRRFLSLLATRIGQPINQSEIAAPLGVSQPTVRNWISVLEVTGQIFLVPPWFENLGKRLVKAPKLYFSDTGLACHLLGIETEAELERSPFLGAMFECFVGAEIIKSQLNRGRRRELYSYRDASGLEVDFVVPGPGLRPILVEAKATHTPMPRDATSIRKLRALLGPSAGPDYVVHRESPNAGPRTTLAPNVVPVSTLEVLAALP